jgi:hypothetical protein
MRPIAILSCLGLATLVASALACSGSPTDSGFGGTSSGSGGGSNSSGGGSNSSGSSGGSNSSGSGSGSFGSSSSSGGSSDAGGDVIVTVKTTIYANTDDTLYSVDPMTNAVTEIGPIAGAAEGGAGTMTDCAVDANGDVYLNSESAVYKATLPSSTPGTVNITQVASLGSGTYFYALAFAPAGALDANNETLVGGDSKGNLYSINTQSGTTTNLGSFGNDASGACTTAPCVFELSGDVVFYQDSMGNPTGLATIRSCPSMGKSSGCSADWLAGVDMTALKTAYTSGMPAASLLKGIYGAPQSGATTGPGTGYHDVFGLGAWNTEVFGFTRHTSSQSAPMLIKIDTSTGAGTMVSNNFSFMNGWSGAGVTTKVTITVPPPPPPPPNNQ